MHKHSRTKFLTMWKKNQLQSIAKSAEETKKSRKNALPQATALIF